MPHTNLKQFLQKVWEEVGFKERHICCHNFPTLDSLIFYSNGNDFEVFGKLVPRPVKKFVPKQLKDVHCRQKLTTDFFQTF